MPGAAGSTSCAPSVAGRVGAVTQDQAGLLLSSLAKSETQTEG